MRDPMRIHNIANKLVTYWLNNPDLRLGQIVSNASSTLRGNTDPFHMEEEEFEAWLDMAQAETNLQQAKLYLETATEEFRKRRHT